MEAVVKGDLRGAEGGVLNHEDMLLPLLHPGYAPGKAPVTWIEAVFVALLERATSLGVANGEWAGRGCVAGLSEMSTVNCQRLVNPVPARTLGWSA